MVRDGKTDRLEFTRKVSFSSDHIAVIFALIRLHFQVLHRKIRRRNRNQFWIMNDTGNATELVTPVGRTIAIVLYSLCAILILVCNAFTIYILQTCPNAFQDNTSLFFKALAIVDMCGGLFGAFWDIATALPSQAGFVVSGHFCTLLPTIYYSIFDQTLAILFCINVDRLLTIVLPLRYPVVATSKHAKLVLFFALVTPLVFTVFLWPIPGFPNAETYWILCADGNLNNWGNLDINYVKELSWALLLTPGALTITITTISNTCLLFISCRHIRKMKRTANHQRVNEEQRNGQDIMKGVRTVLVITGFCYIGMGIWIFNFAYVYPQLGYPGSKYTVPFIIGAVVELSTRWWNCLIYLSTSQTFRQHATKALRRFYRGRNNQIVI